MGDCGSVSEQRKSHRGGRAPVWPCAVFPVRTARDHARAIAILDQLVPLNRPTAAERDWVDIMLPVVEAYERKHHAIDTTDRSAVDLLRSLMADHGMSAADLGRLLGNRSVGGAVLRGERGLSKNHVRILAERFGVSPAAFL